jgi:hypothetical protein
VLGPVSTVDLWPATGLTVLDENGDVIPSGGITVSLISIEQNLRIPAYYEALLIAGDLLSYDPAGGGPPASVVDLDYGDQITIGYNAPNYTRTAATLTGNLTGISNKFGTVDTAVTAATNTANTASSTATTAASNAATALSTANTANTAAATAQTTANTAVTNAATAQTTANTAVTNAATAQTTADAKAAKWSFGSALSGTTALSASDNRKTRLTSGSNPTVQISGSAGHAAHDEIAVLHRGSGTCTFTGTNGMTVNRPAGTANTGFDVGSYVLILFESSTVCHLIGRLTPA